MNIATGGAAVGIFMVFLYFSIHISYGQNANISSGLMRFGHTFQQLDKDTNAVVGNFIFSGDVVVAQSAYQYL
jgi:hypothetical protein